MQRPIKFRAWQKQASLHRPIGMYVVNDFLLYDEPFGINTGEVFFKSYTSSEFLEDVELMQYTGLKDKNGVDIYEGDILRLTNTPPHVTSTVRWNSDLASFCGDAGDHLFGVHLCEVIGNIYENPELLGANTN